MFKAKIYIRGKMLSVFLAFSILSFTGFLKLAHPQNLDSNQVTLGVLFAELDEPGKKERDRFLKTAEKFSARLVIKDALASQELQMAQAEELINQGIKVLLINPCHPNQARRIVENAHKKGVIVIAFERIIKVCDLDYYVGFDYQKIGELQAESALQRAPSGNYLLIPGARSDYDAQMIRTGWKKALNPLVSAGTIKIVLEQSFSEKNLQNPKPELERALKKVDNQIKVALTGNDILTEAMIEFLAEKEIGENPLVIGQGADLNSLRRVANGSQAMTVYKPIPELALTAIELSLKVAKKEKVNYLINNTVNNEFKEVPSILIKPIILDKNNLEKFIIQGQIYTKEQIYGN